MKSHFSQDGEPGEQTTPSRYSFLPFLVGLSSPQADTTNLERTRLVCLVAITSYNCRRRILINSAVDTAFGRSVGGGKPLLCGWMAARADSRLAKAFNHPLKDLSYLYRKGREGK